MAWDFLNTWCLILEIGNFKWTRLKPIALYTVQNTFVESAAWRCRESHQLGQLSKGNRKFRGLIWQLQIMRPTWHCQEKGVVCHQILFIPIDTYEFENLCVLFFLNMAVGHYTDCHASIIYFIFSQTGSTLMIYIWMGISWLVHMVLLAIIQMWHAAAFSHNVLLSPLQINWNLLMTQQTKDVPAEIS